MRSAVRCPDVPAVPAPSAASSRPVTEPPVAPAPATARSHLSTQEIAEFLARGDTLLRQGDVTSARLFYERAADAGDGQVALQLGATSDPTLRGLDVLRGVSGDATEASFGTDVLLTLARQRLVGVKKPRRDAMK
jgi:hypothetical protein